MSRRRGQSASRSGLGLLLLAIGRERGFACFGTDTDSYLGSLAPLVAFTMVSAGLLAATGSFRTAASLFLLSLCQVLAPAVIADPFCRRWGRAHRWALYATILNWAPFLLFMVLAAVMAAARLAVEAGVPPDLAASVALLILFAYIVWFQWFVARGALDITRWRTVQLLGATMIFGLVLVLIQAAFGAGADAFQFDVTAPKISA